MIVKGSFDAVVAGGCAVLIFDCTTHCCTAAWCSVEAGAGAGLTVAV